jgi:hypothetical protein
MEHPTTGGVIMSQLKKCTAGFSLFLLLFSLAVPVHSQVTDSTNSLTTKQILDLSGGARVKLVWDRFLNRGNPTDQIGPNHALVAFDTYEKKERVLQATPAAYDYPIFTHDGTRVIWNDMPMPNRGSATGTVRAKPGSSRATPFRGPPISRRSGGIRLKRKSMCTSAWQTPIRRVAT